MAEKEVGFFKIDERIARNDIAKGADNLKAIMNLLNTKDTKDNLTPETLTEISKKVKDLAEKLANDVNEKIKKRGVGLGNFELSNDGYVDAYAKAATIQIVIAVNDFSKTANANVDDLLKRVEDQMRGMNENDVQIAALTVNRNRAMYTN